MTLSEIQNVSGEEGDFTVKVRQKPRYIDVDKCIACGDCAKKCPKKVDNEYNELLDKRKAVYVQYAQAVPLKYGIDADNCIYFLKGKCKACQKFCPTGAVDFTQQPREIEVKVGSIILAPGFKAFDPTIFSAYQYSNHPNVITALEFERLLAASGPTMGHLVRPGDDAEPTRIAFLQCVGSRDMNRCDNGYCSSVCCMYALKEAVIAKEHSHNPLDISVFFHGYAHLRQGFRTLLRKGQDPRHQFHPFPDSYGQPQGKRGPQNRICHRGRQAGR